MVALNLMATNWWVSLRSNLSLLKNNQTYAPSTLANQLNHHHKALPNHTNTAKISHHL